MTQKKFWHRLARSRRWSWEDGRLAAKQLFDALHEIGILPERCFFLNWFDLRRRKRLRELIAQGYKVIGMGLKVQLALDKSGIEHIGIIHPAARGKIRRKENYTAHIRQRLA
jgi:hypothetical protein